VRPVQPVGELSVGGGHGRGEVGGLTAGFAADGAGMSSKGGPFARPRTTGFQTALGIAEILSDLNRQVSSSCAPSASIAARARQMSFTGRPPMTLCLTRPNAPQARAQTLGTATEFTFTQSRRAG
jgi:hypothetical protein